MWVAVTSPGTEIDAAERGMGSLGLTFGGFKEQEKKVNNYRKIIRNCEPVGKFINEKVATVNFLFCHNDDEVGVKTGLRLTGTFNYLASQLLAAREAYPTKSYPSLGLAAFAAPGGLRPRRRLGRAGRDRDRQSCPHHQSHQGMGIDRRRSG